jgi:hypothetical protein
MGCKILEGTWVVALMLPALSAFFAAERSHDQAAAREAATDTPLDARDLAPLPVRGWSAITRKAPRFALKVSPVVLALHVADDRRATLDLEDGWRHAGRSMCRSSFRHRRIRWRPTPRSAP